MSRPREVMGLVEGAIFFVAIYLIGRLLGWWS